MRRFRKSESPKVPDKKVWVAKYDLPKLKSYEGNFSEAFWGKWPVNTMKMMMPPQSWVSWKELEMLARAQGYNDRKRLVRTVERLKRGADIGCRGRGRIPTVGENSESAFEYGDRVTDALREWVESELVVGPLRREEIPAGVSVSPIMVRLKPNGKARIILNFSHPYDRKDVPEEFYQETDPGSVNAGIKGEEYPAKMSSIQKFLCSLVQAGVNSFIIG